MFGHLNSLTMETIQLAQVVLRGKAVTMDTPMQFVMQAQLTPLKARVLKQGGHRRNPTM